MVVEQEDEVVVVVEVLETESTVALEELGHQIR
jgi:hypothetical protein